jgi:uncharacterized protein with NRDE domain
MCSLFVLRGVDPQYPLLIAANRDEARARAAAPPGLFVAGHRRMLSPRDRRAGGTWQAVDERLRFAGLTNVAGAPVRADAKSRGHLPHLALAADDFDAAAELVAREVRAHAYNAFQLLLCAPERCLVLRWADAQLARTELTDSIVTLSNEHAANQLRVPDLAAAAAPGLTLDARLAALATVLLDRGERSGHRVLKSGGDYGTVSSSLLAIPAKAPRDLIWRYCAGSPDLAPYRNYGNLARRLLDT